MQTPTPNKNKIFGENLRKRREDAGISRKDAAEIVGVSLRSFASYERGEAYPLAATLPKIATVLHCSIDELFGYSVNDFDKAVNFLVDQCNLGVYGIDKQGIMIGHTSKEPWAIFNSKDDFVKFVKVFKKWFLHSSVYEEVSRLALQSFLPPIKEMTREERDKRDVRIIRCRAYDLMKKGKILDDIIQDFTYMNNEMKKFLLANKQDFPPKKED